MNALKTQTFSGDNHEIHTEQLNPSHYFVIKTKAFSSYRGHRPGTKLFINVCADPLVPLPMGPDMQYTEDFKPESVFPLIMNNKWEIPILTSPGLRDGKDKSGNHCFLIDCVINNKPMTWCLANNQLKMILVQWCFDSVEFRIGDNFLIDRDVIKFPKRAYMGEPVTIEVNLDDIKNDGKSVQKLESDFHKDKPSNLIDAQRYDREKHELHELKLGNGNSISNEKSNLIEEIDSKDTKEIHKSSTHQPTLITFTVNFKKLKKIDTEDQYKYLLQVRSALTASNSYKISYQKSNATLILDSSNPGKAKKVKFPLPKDIDGMFIAFYSKEDQCLCIFIK